MRPQASQRSACSWANSSTLRPESEAASVLGQGSSLPNVSGTEDARRLSAPLPLCYIPGDQ